jgi:hypothetical protein
MGHYRVTCHSILIKRFSKRIYWVLQAFAGSAVKPPKAKPNAQTKH